MAKILKGEELQKQTPLQQRIEWGLAVALGETPALGRVVEKEVLDASGQAKRLLTEAKHEALRIKGEAKELLNQVEQEVAASKQAGFDQGYEAGLQQGLELLVKVKEFRRKLFEDNEKEILRLVFGIAEKIIGRELIENDKAIMNVVRLAVNDAVGEKIYLHLHPNDYVKIKKHETELMQRIESGKNIVFRQDDAVGEGGCIVETEVGTIDAQLATQLQAIKKVLGVS